MTTTDLALLPENPVAVLTDAKTYSEFYAKMKAETDAFVPDISTVKGRGEIAALAYKVTRTKTAIDAAGKKLNEDARATINAVDASRRKIRDELDALADAVRKPLTEWEEAEKAREEVAVSTLDQIAAFANIGRDAFSANIAQSIAFVKNTEIDPDIFRDGLNEAIAIKQSALVSLNQALLAAEQREADAAELTRLRAEAEAREVAERERIERERIAKEVAEKEAREKAEYEANVKRQAEAAEKAKKEAAERDRLAELARLKAIADAAEAAREEERRKAEEARKAEDEARAEERRKAEAAEKQAEAYRQDAIRKANEAHAAELAKIEAENRRLAQAEADRLAKIEKTAAEERIRQEDRKHRGEIMGAAKTAMMELGATEEVAKKIVLAIVAGEIPAVTLRF